MGHSLMSEVPLKSALGNEIDESGGRRSASTRRGVEKVRALGTGDALVRGHGPAWPGRSRLGMTLEPLSRWAMRREAGTSFGRRYVGDHGALERVR